jgi:very-short-patch-repair endonuclease
MLCESPIERMLYTAMLNYGLFPVTQHWIGQYRVDFAFIEEHVVVEADGKWHKKIKHKDAVRDAYIRKRGWKIIHVTGRSIFADANKCARRIKKCLRELN